MSNPDKKAPDDKPEELELWAYMAEFDHADTVIHAAEKVRDAGFTKWDVHTPFPVHGLDKAMGIKYTILPWIVLCAGLTGTTVAILLQLYTNTMEGAWNFSGYAYDISGKPNSMANLPAWVPVAFELTILFSALTAVFGSLALNGLPRPYFPAWRNKRFDRATADRFYVLIDAKDPKFAEAKGVLAGLGAIGEVEALEETKGGGSLPKGFVWAGVALVLASWIPFAVILKKRYSTTEAPPIHIVPNMDWQQKYKAQTASPLFADGRAMRLPVENAVPRGALDNATADGHSEFDTGRGADGTLLATMPVDATAELLARGERMYNIHCIVCHGQLGDGDGMVNKRALMRQESAWVPPTKIFDSTILGHKDGYFFDVITNGVRTMKGYGSSIEVKDRWAIVLWVRALQRKHRSRFDTLPADIQKALR